MSFQAKDPTSETPHDFWKGPWGTISPSPQSVTTLRLSIGPFMEQTYSYPYRVLSSWHWQKQGSQEQLTLQAASDKITIRGQGLSRLVDALDQGSLESICQSTHLIPNAPIEVTSITVISG